MALGTRLLNWPWRWLTTRAVPSYQVGEVVVPTLDVGSHNPVLQLYQESFVMAAGINVILLPGLSRAAQLNPAALPEIQSRGARRWINLTMQSDTATVTPLCRLAVVRGPSSPDPDVFTNGNTLPAAQQRPMLGVNAAGGGTSLVAGGPRSLYIPDPLLLRWSITGQAGGEVIIIRGVFLEADTLDEPLPSMWD